MAYSHCQIQIPILIRTTKQMPTLYYLQHFTLHRVSFRFPSQLLSTGMGSKSGSESESGSVNVNKPLELVVHGLSNYGY